MPVINKSAIPTQEIASRENPTVIQGPNSSARLQIMDRRSEDDEKKCGPPHP